MEKSIEDINKQIEDYYGKALPAMKVRHEYVKLEAELAEFEFKKDYFVLQRANLQHKPLTEKKDEGV